MIRVMVRSKKTDCIGYFYVTDLKEIDKRKFYVLSIDSIK